MAEVDELLGRVVAESGRSEAEIRAKIAARKDKTHGLLSDYGALYAVAKEFGVDLNQSKTPVIRFSEVSGQKSLNVYGRVKAVYSPREFARKDGSKGFFASLILLDESGEMRLVLWDKNTELTKSVQVGDAVLVRNAYSKENQGVFEVHAGALSTIAVNPEVPEVKLPDLSEKLSKVSELSEGNPSVSVVLRVSGYLPRTEFKRGDGSTGARASFTGEDESGKIRVVLWDKASEVEVSDGDVVKIENGYTRRGLAGEIELQAGSRSRIVASDKKLILPPIKTGEKLGISDLKPDSTSLSVEARVLRVYPPRAYSGGTLSSMIVGDKSGTIRVVLWDDKSGRVQEFARNDAVLIQNAYARANMNEEVEVHVGKYGGIKKIADSKVPKAEDIEMKYTQAKTIAELEPSEERVRISAKIVDLEERSIFYMTCPSCSGKVQNVGGAWFCDACGDVDPTPNLVVSAVLEDDSGTVRGVFFRESAEKILGLDAEAAMNLIGETQDEAAPLKEAKEKLRKNAVDLLGRGRYNDYSDQLEFIVDEFS